jgi:anti-anti-sigma factor
MNTARPGALTAKMDTPSKLEGVWATLTRLAGGRVRNLESVPGGLRVAGALDKGIARELKARAKALAEGDTAGFSIDLAEVTSWDGDGLAALVYALDVSELAGKRLVLLEPCARLRHTLERSQLHHLFAIVHRDELAA